LLTSGVDGTHANILHTGRGEAQRKGIGTIGLHHGTVKHVATNDELNGFAGNTLTAQL